MDYITNYLGFIGAVIILSLTPGSDTIFILTKSIAGGYRQGFASVALALSVVFLYILH